MRWLSDLRASELAEIFRSDESIVVAYLFGSRLRGTSTPESDIDVAVLLSKLPDEMLDYYLDLMGRLSRFLGDRVDLVILNTAPPLLRHQVIAFGKIIYSRDERARVEFEAHADREYLDFSRFRDKYNESLLEEMAKWKG